MRLTVDNVAQIANADIDFGDLTILVGAQGTGKTIFLQLLKFCVDMEYIKDTMNDFGQTWDKKQSRSVLAPYLGEAMSRIWDDDKSKILQDGNSFCFSSNRNLGEWRTHKETVYYIPAQRALVMPDGWPNPFRTYSPKTPFTVRNFSEHLRLYLENTKEEQERIFPILGKLKYQIRELFNQAIFHNAVISQNSYNMQKELSLTPPDCDNTCVPYIAWSAGQREFLPLLLGCYELLPEGKVSKRQQYEWVIIEEPEMGLHPKAIFATMSLVLDLLSRGYQVVISTHSPNILDIVWAFKTITSLSLNTEEKTARIKQLFEFDQNDVQITEMIQKCLTKSMRTYYFEFKDKKVVTSDISALDPGEEDNNVSGWGGLSGYSGHAANVVSKAIVEAIDEQ